MTVTTDPALATETPSEGVTPDAGLEAPATEPAPTEQPSGSEGGDQSQGAETQPKTYIAKVNGQDVEVTEAELVNGYQRQKDYTSKTQEVAAERARLVQAEAIYNALLEDPTGTLAQLQDHFKDASAVEGEAPDPVQAKLGEHDAFIQQQQAAEVERQVNAELSELNTEFGEFDGNDLLEYAIEQQIPNLRAAYLHREDSNARVEKNRQNLLAKQKAPPISGGSKAAGTVEAPAVPISDMTLTDALEAAKAELNYQE